jgi:soluble lytic murein transglycosylase-like protein
VKAVALVESGFNPDAVSPKGAQGIMQLMPSTAKRYGVRNAFDPLENLRAGTMHLRSLLDEFDGDVRLALAAYNAGSGAVRRHGGVPAYPETQEYVRKIESTMGKPARRARAPRPPPPKVQVVREADGTITFDNIE